MEITKIGHCCLVIKIKSLTILTDPGAFSVGQNSVRGVDVVLITHEHQDHIHIDSLKQVLANNPSAKVVTNSGVAKLLAEAGIAYELLEGTASTEMNGVSIEAHDGRHGEIYGDFGQVQNTGFFIAGRLFYPGDSFHNPDRPVEILALPVAGPWCPLREAIDFALKLKPKRVFPVHDGLIKDEIVGALNRLPAMILKEKGIDFVMLKAGDTEQF